MKTNEKRFNTGTSYGKELIKHSLQELGCGRSVLADKNNVIIAGNDVYTTAIELGKKIITIETDGDVLVVVKRTDVDANETKGLELAFVDNVSQERNLDWDEDLLFHTMNKNISFDPRKWGGHSALVKELNIGELLRNNVPVVDKKNKKEEPVDSYNQLSLFDL